MATPAFAINFMGQRKTAALLSIILVVASIASLATRGLDLGLDFLGGTQMEVTYQESADLSKARQVLQEQGFDDANVVYFGTETEVMIRFHRALDQVAEAAIADAVAEVAPAATITEVVKRSTGGYEASLTIANAEAVKENLATVFPPRFYGPVQTESLQDGSIQFLLSTSLNDAMVKALVNALAEAAGSDVSLNYTESVDSQVGAEMFENAMIGLLVALLIVMGYVAFRFQYKFALGAVVALIHDVIVVLGIFSFFHWGFDLTVFAAILAVIGYSLNDTIVVSDRMRENFRIIRKMEPKEIVNTSLNQVFGRTIITSLTTLLVLVALWVFGGEAIEGFALALIVGILVGTYSSIYVCANMLLALHITKEDLMVPVKEGEEFEELP